MGFVLKGLDTVQLYDRLVPKYDRLHARWLRFAGGEAQAALEAVVRAVWHTDMALLDVGCGTGRFARRLLSEGVAAQQMTLLDPSERMLQECADMGCERVAGRLELLPFGDSTFDIVTCAWALETAPDLRAAMHELCRVLRPGGVLCLAFCADVPVRDLSGRALRGAVRMRGTGAFLRPGDVVDAIPVPEGMDVRLLPCHGPAAAMVVRKSLPDHAERRFHWIAPAKCA